ncbi:DNA repair ATPase [Nocardiopsis sp. HNM0947]|uniref:DNA repair ATPase n=1 Tax=Nocardiopsis coralli TaxID=2772213 RepID=A0ABR9P4V6_9ACTN|nr:DNA repair ATPase [Nocardiopsis coralli]MBE2998864.1 DNA repair ATPase [Nocardiopsis coralli]
MTEADENGGPGPGAEDAQSLDAGTYEVLRARLLEQTGDLARRTEELNTRRLDVFGGTELSLLGTERIRTEHNCVPQDIVSVGRSVGAEADGDLILFGYNVYLGMQRDTRVSDVFSLHRYEHDGDSFAFTDAAEGSVPGLLDDERFRQGFTQLYRYYRDARLQRLRRIEDRLLAVFRTGPRSEDVRVLRWSVTPEGEISYLDDRGERDHVFGDAHDVTWVETTREDHVLGRHPHISVLDELFVETVGGDLTIKVENNTEVGEGIYAEPVDEPLQSLADADVYYARAGSLILLRIRPYNESRWRHLVFNTRTKGVERLDGIGRACRRLPDDQGIVFPGGYYLSTGVSHTFDTDVTDLDFEAAVRSPNGEDVLYVFHSGEDGRSLLLSYNTIRKEVATPIVCHGYSLFDDGTMTVFRGSDGEPTRVHPMQVWRTPYVSDVYAAAQPVGSGPLERVGNAELVRGISESLSVARMAEDMEPSVEVFEGIIRACRRVSDQFHWLGDEALCDLATPLQQVRGTAERVLEEYETVQALTQQAADTLAETEEKLTRLIRTSRGEAPRSAEGWVRRLTELRRAQGQAATLREMRYVDTDRLDTLDENVAEEITAAGKRTVAFLEREDAFDGYHAEVERLVSDAESIEAVSAATAVGERIAEQTEGLQVVTEVVGSLDIGDAQVRTRILERVSEVMAGVNRARATLDSRRKELLSREGRAEFAAEFALLGQAITGALAGADTPDACDEQLGRIMLQLENLESRFAEFDEFLGELADKREDVYEAFSTRKQSLVDARARRADRLSASAERVLEGVHRRVSSLETLEDINTYFASDAMVQRLRRTVEEMRELGDSVRAEELEGRILAARQEAGRALRDRADLVEGGPGGETIRFGQHRFAVNTQPIDLTLTPHDGEMAVAITGTDFRAPVTDEAFRRTRHLWNRLLVSESDDVYRSEYLATSILAAAEDGGTASGSRSGGGDRTTGGDRATDGLTLEALHEAEVHADNGDSLLSLVRRVAEERYDEGYERGVHDHDAALILSALLRLRSGAGLLRYPGPVRAAAQVFWAFGAEETDQRAWRTRAASLARAREVFGARRSSAIGDLHTELAEAVDTFLTDTGLLPGTDLDLVGEYLFEELAADSASERGFVSGAPARTLLDRFHRALGGSRETTRKAFADDLRALEGDLAARYQLVTAWLEAFADTQKEVEPGALPEAAAIELAGTRVDRYESSAAVAETVTGMLGSHPRVRDRSLEVRLDEILPRTRRFRAEDAPAYREFQRRRNEFVAAERERLRLEEYKPKVMSGFVRNRLLDESYLPLIGDNLAKQVGAAGDGKRTDQSGLLLLISPPGYGKTTLMEYVAGRLGLVFVKVNGPALGHTVTSLDPADAPDATSRQEVEKISFALEMGSNTMLYLDDIQHTSPELLQKFISLCDGQRRMEGVWEGRTRTYDLRGKRFAVCMAGNPYTEQGKRFRIPDMLANRADVYNLGDVLSGKEDLFALSYIENALTSNPTLAPLSTRSREDVYTFVRMARGDESVGTDQLEHPYSAAEVERIVSVLRKLLRVQEVVLANNQAYIASAAQSEDARTEPPFQLQGSYRNMNRLAEKVVPVMNDAEVEAAIDDHYLGEAQTLTSGAEANLLKLAELRGTLDAEQEQRWREIKEGFRRGRALGGADDDPLTRAVGAMGLLADRVGEIGTAIDRAAEQ